MVTGNEQVTKLNELTQLPLSSYPFTKQYQQKPPYSLRNSVEIDCDGHTNIEDMRQSGNEILVNRPWLHV